MCFFAKRKINQFAFCRKFATNTSLHSFLIGRRSLWLSEKGVKKIESILKRRTLHRRRILRAARPRSLHGTFLDLDFRSSLLYRAPPFAFSILLLCRVHPASLRLATRRLLPTTSSCNSSILAILASACILRLACWCTNRGATSRYFCWFYFGEHLVVGMRTKETCSLRKSQEARGWLAPAVRLIYLFLVT